MARFSSVALRRPARVVLTVAVLVALWQHPAIADVSEVTGGAYGFSSSVSLFDGPAVDSGPLPVVTLPPEGSPTPITESDPDGESAQQGPAIVVQATAMTVSTEGTTGVGGSVTSSASVVFGDAEEERVDPFSADEVGSTCTASESEVTGAAALDNASLVTSTDLEGEPVEVIDLPENPAPNTTLSGTNDAVGDTFRIVLNEQIREGDTLTVNAVHVFLGQNAQGASVDAVARGEAILGQSVCGVVTSVASSRDADISETVPDAAAGGNDDRQATTTTTPGEAVAVRETGELGSSRPSPLFGVLVGGLVAALFVWLRHLRPRPRHRR